MIIFKNKKLRVRLCVMLAALMVLNTAIPVLSLIEPITIGGSRQTEAATENIAGYENPYLYTVDNTSPPDLVQEGTRSHTTASGQNASDAGFANNINTVEKLVAFAQYSQDHDTSGKTYKITYEGAIDVSGSTDFKGIGSAQYPFRGTIIGIYQEDTQNEIITGDYSLFNYLSNEASITRIKVTATGSSSGLADNLVLESQTSGTYTSVSVNGSVLNNFAGENAAMLFGSVENAQDFTSAVTMNLSDTSISSTGVSNYYNGNAGLIAGNIGAGVQLTLNNGVTVGNTSFVKSYGGDAGILAGSIASGALLTLTGSVSVTGGTGENVTAYREYDSENSIDNGGNAGALVGSMTGATLTVNGVSVASSVVAGGKNIGVMCGSAENSAINCGITENDVFTAAQMTATSTVAKGGVNCGAVYGSLTDPAAGYAYTPSATDNLTVTLIPTDDMSLGKATAGGLCGALSLNEAQVGTKSFTASFASVNNTAPLNITFQNVSGDGTDADTEAGKANITLGGLVGIYTSGTKADTFTVTGGDSVKAALTSAYSTQSGVYSYGGVVGTISENSYCKITNISEITGDNDVYAIYFGGAAALVSDGAVLDVNTLTVDGRFCVRYDEAYAGGLCGYTGVGSVLHLNGTLSYGVHTYGSADNEGNYADKVGQIVGAQESSLIYAETAWTFQRCARSGVSNDYKYVMDDIGNYGEVYRNVSGVITLDTGALTHTHTVSFTKLTYDSGANTYTLSSPADMLCLSITLSSHGEFSAVNGVSKNNFTDLLSADITIGADISLTGTGIVSLTRNDTTDNSTFTGTITGANIGTDNEPIKPTITLASGEAYGSGTYGNGVIYAQQYAGLFSALGSGAEIENLTVDGTVTCGTTPSGISLQNDAQMKVGAIAGEASGTVTITGVTSSVEIYEKNSRTNSTGSNLGYYGGLIGRYTGNALTVTDCISDTDIYIYSNNVTNNSISGGLVGNISFSEDGNSFENTTLTGSITTDGAVRCAMAGGLFGTLSNTNETATPDIKLTIDKISIPQTGGQTISAPNATIASPSLIGYSAADSTIVLTNTSSANNILYGSLSCGTSVASGTAAANFGGLFFEITGKLALDKTEVRGSFTGNHALSGTALSDGLVVCRGFGLYMTVDEPTVVIAPTVTESRTGNKAYCDDLVGNNKASTNENGGIVTIETGDDIGSTASGKWSYSSADRKENPHTRYYYNVEGLDIDHNNDTYLVSNTFNTREDVLLWHILNYTSFTASIKVGDERNSNGSTSFPGKDCAYFFSESMSDYAKNQDYSAETDADLDMSGGFCIYPTSISGGEYNFNNAAITFDNTDVNDNLPTNAKTTDTLCQHYMMQTGLFWNTSGSAAVNDLTLSGNAGMWGSGSGALVCGGTKGTASSIANLSLNGIVLDDLYINGCNVSSNYAPLLINMLNTYSNAQITDVTESYASRTTKAGSSLIGRVGSESATHINITFSQMKLDGLSSNSLFYRASFIDSFQYMPDGTSSGVYNFKLGEDWTGTGTSATHTPNKVTYGYELEADGTKYLDEQSIFVDPTKNNNTTAAYDFDSQYLPYVYLYVTPGDATNVNKLNVNIAGNLTVGCGTYEDPYVITTAQQLLLLSQCLTTGTIPAAWQVNYPNDSLCEGKADHSLYEYTGNGTNFTFTKKSGSGTASEIKPTWFAHAYYKLDSNITFSSGDNFYGIGGDNAVGSTSANAPVPFAGVFVGRNSSDTANYSITIPKPSNADEIKNLGFILYSAGCVLKDIDIEYTDNMTVSNPTGSGANMIPSSVGGAICTVMGGDNIIDNVLVSFTQSVSVTNRLTYVGGYVGLINSGGVVFRNMESGTGVTTAFVSGGQSVSGAASTWFYVNPYVGRVLDGYALYENTDGSDTREPLDNTDKNYTIPMLTPDTTLVNILHPGTNVDGTGTKSNRQYNQVTIKNAAGLYVYASSVNCGAQCTGGVFAYGAESRVRNAKYDYVGQYDSSVNAQSTDRTEAVIDNTAISYTYNLNTTQKPYLCKTYMSGSNYTNYTTGSGQRTLISLTAGGDYDMTDYGNGYGGISSRYAYRNDSDKTYKKTWSSKQFAASDNKSYGTGSPDRVSPITENIANRVCFDGKSATVTLSMNVKQYDGDPYYTNNIGLFNRTNNAAEQAKLSSTYRDVTLSGTCTLAVYNPGTGAEIQNTYNIDIPVSVGALVGCPSQNNNSYSNGTMNCIGIKTKNLTVSSTGYTGSILGKAVDRKAIAVTNCTAENITVTGLLRAGGLVGSSSIQTSFTYTAGTTAIDSATIVNKASVDDNKSNYIAGVGGLCGYTDGAGTLAATNTVVTNARLFNSEQLVTEYNANNSITNSALAALLNSNRQAHCGALFGYCTSTGAVTVTNAAVSSSLIVSYNNAGGIVGKPAGGEFTVQTAALTNNRVIAQENSGAVSGYVASTLNCNGITVGGAAAADGCSMLSVGISGDAGGVLGAVEKSKAVSLKDIVVNNSLVYSSGFSAGGIVGRARIGSDDTTQTTINTASVLNSRITVKSGLTAGGVIGETNGKAYLSNITVSDSKIATNGDTYAAGICATANSALYGSNILWKNNTMGISSVTDTNIMNGTAPAPTANALCKTWVGGGSGSVSLSAVSRQDMNNIRYIECGVANNAIVYADYSGTKGAGAATLGADIPDNPSVVLAGDTLKSDGVAAGKPTQIFTEDNAGTLAGRYSVSSSLTSLTDENYSTYLKKINDYFTSDATLPLLYVKGEANSLITDYANLLTNGGFSAFRENAAAGTSVTVTSKRYSISGSTVTSDAEHSSVTYNTATGTFGSAQSYDSLIKTSNAVTGMTFSVVTISFTNPTPSGDSANAVYNMSFAVYYPQVLTVTKNVQIVDHEEYKIQSIINKTADDIDAKANTGTEPSVNITDGGTFTAYFEYVYNELRMNDNWNYDKEIATLYQLPEGTRFTVVDLNSTTVENDVRQTDSTGYRAYYYTLDYDDFPGNTMYKNGKYVIPFSKFNDYSTITDGVPAKYTSSVNLQDLPSYDPDNTSCWYDYGENTDGYASERYLIVVNLPQGDPTQVYNYPFYAGLDTSKGDGRNVELQNNLDNDPDTDENHNRTVTVWPNPDITVTPNSNAEHPISKDSPIEATFTYTVSFPDSYTGTFRESSPKYGVIRYTVMDDINELSLPAGTVITIGTGEDAVRLISDGTTSYYQSVIMSGANEQNLLSLDAITTVNGVDTYTYTQQVSLDFSQVSASDLRDVFPTGKDYSLRATLYLTSDSSKPTIGDNGWATITLLSTLHNVAALKVNVDNDSLLHLGYNILDDTDTTNDGIIEYNVILDLSGCTSDVIEDITGSTVTLDYTLYKKNAQGVYQAVAITNYLSNTPVIALTEYNAGKMQYQMTDAQKQAAELHLQRPDTATDEPDAPLPGYANYKLEVAATLHGLRENGEDVTLSDYFIYTVANINPTYAE